MLKPYSNLVQTKNFRKDLRKKQTKPEQLLWFGLRKNNLNYKFRRQYGIGKYIVDFYCHELKLIIEVDGTDHSYRYEEDIVRQNYLEKLGYKILRYKNKQVEETLENVIVDIKMKCQKRESELGLAKPHPRHPLIGEGKN